jgi:hypothetical protein
VAEVLDVEAVLCRVLVWLIERQVRLLDVQRTHIEMYGRWLEEQGGAGGTVGRRLSTLARFFPGTANRNKILARVPGMPTSGARTGLRVAYVGVGPQRTGRLPGGCRVVIEPGPRFWRRCWC